MQAITCPHLDECPYRPGVRNKSKISKQLIDAVVSSERPMYQISSEAKVAPAILSKAVNGKYLFKNNDERILRIASIIGFSGPCFEDENGSGSKV